MGSKTREVTNASWSGVSLSVLNPSIYTTLEDSPIRE